MIGVGDPVWLGGIVAAVIIAALVLGRSVKAQLGSMSVTVDSVNRAVNNRKPGQPTISDQVALTASRVDDIHANVSTLAVKMDRGMADVNKAVDSLDQRVSALDVRVSALETASTPPQPSPNVHVTVTPPAATN